MSDLLSALADSRPEDEYYLSLKTGEVRLLTEESLDEEKEEIFNSPHAYVLLPKKMSRQGYQDLVDFVESMESQTLCEKLEVAIQGQGAFRRFKDVLPAYSENRCRWFAFSTGRDENRLKEWLEENAIALEWP